MRVAIEAAALGLSSGGLARYTGELSLALARCFPNDSFFLLSDQPFVMPSGAPPNLQRGRGPTNAVERRWWLWGLPNEMRRLGADLVHGPDFAVPYLTRKPSVLTLHDLSPWMDERWHHAAGRVRRRTPLLLELGIATMVITPGEGVRKQAIARFRLKPDRVVAIPEAAPSWLGPVEPDGPRDPYFLYLGTLEPRKNIETLLEAWREVRRRNAVRLLLAGRVREDFTPPPPEPGLELLGEVPDSALAALYSGALAFVYPSLYEGFGLPVLEAMQCGACVIASPAVAEVAGDAAACASDARELAALLETAVTQPDWVADHRARSLIRARDFSWDNTARSTYEVYREARRRFAR